jgi:hypothetical protein
MLCPNDIYVFGGPVGGTNKSMRKESMEIIEIASVANSGGRKLVLKAQSARDSIMLVHAQLPYTSRLNSTVDILETAVVLQRRHVKHEAQPSPYNILLLFFSFSLQASLQVARCSNETLPCRFEKNRIQRAATV